MREDESGGGGQSSARPGEISEAALQSSAQESFLAWMIHSSGAVRLVSLVIAAMSFYLFALVIWMALYRRNLGAKVIRLTTQHHSFCTLT